MEMHRLKNGGDRREGDEASQTSSHHRRKKNMNRSRPSSGYLQEWVHQSRSFMAPTAHYDPQCGQLVGPYWEVAGSPRMFAAFSDPTVCRYSVPTAPPPPLAYSYEPVSLPIYQPAYQPPMPPSSVGAWRSPQHIPSRGNSKPGSPKHSGKSNFLHPSKPSNKLSSSRLLNASNSPSSHQISHGGTAQEEYLSLPPGTQQGCDLDDSHRRFSDPGLARSESEAVPASNVNSNNTNNNNNHEEDNESGEWDHESGSSSTESGNYETAVLSEQLNLLKADNKRLALELRDTKAELHKLKLQAATWGNPMQQDYQPGMIADLVREIRDAAQLREETLLSRLRLMMAEGGVLRLTGLHAHEKENSNLSHQEASLSPLDPQSPEDHRDLDRISRLERQLNSLQLLNGSSDAARREEVLRRELHEAQAARKMAESNVNKLEKLMNMMRKKMNGVSVDDGRLTTTSLLMSPGPGLASRCEQEPASGAADSMASQPPSSLESLTSACSSTHCPGSSDPGAGTSGPATITLSGPVTDL